MSLASTVLEGVIYGASLGMLYVLVALGLTLIFGLMDVVNFAHGAFVTLGAYFGITFIDVTGNFWVAMLLAGLAVALLGLAIERTFIKRLYEENPIYQLLLTFGLALLLEGAVIIVYGQDNQLISPPSILQGAPVAIGPATIPQYRLFLIVFTGLLVAAVWFAIQRTKLGLIVKAGIEDRERAEMLGIRLSRVNMLIMAVGAGLAAVSGVLSGPLLGVNPHLGTGLLIISFVVVVIGGLGNIRGTIVAGLLVGILYSLTSFFYPSLADPSIYVAMAVVLLVKPHGLFGSVEA
jgi:branched-subunit amino acid ABC-type transport system permease component